MHRIQQREQAALVALYRRYGSLVYSLALRVLRQQSLAEEITQDVFIKVWQQADRWNPALGQLSSWLLTITRNAAIDRLRKEQRRPLKDATSLDNVSHLLEGGEPFDNELWHDGQLLRSLMEQLPAEQRQVIELAFFYGLTHSQMAQQLDLPLGTVKTRVRLALSKLRALWQTAHEDDI